MRGILAPPDSVQGILAPDSVHSIPVTYGQLLYMYLRKITPCNQPRFVPYDGQQSSSSRRVTLFCLMYNVHIKFHRQHTRPQSALVVCTEILKELLGWILSFFVFSLINLQNYLVSIDR